MMKQQEIPGAELGLKQPPQSKSSPDTLEKLPSRVKRPGSVFARWISSVKEATLPQAQQPAGKTCWYMSADSEVEASVRVPKVYNGGLCCIKVTADGKEPTT